MVGETPGHNGHNALDNLAVGDPHTQYHNDTRGDNRYLEKPIYRSSGDGPGIEGLPVILDVGGQLHDSFIQDDLIDHSELLNLGVDTHSQYHTDARAAAYFDSIGYIPKESHIALLALATEHAFS